MYVFVCVRGGGDVSLCVCVCARARARRCVYVCARVCIRACVCMCVRGGVYVRSCTFFNTALPKKESSTDPNLPSLNPGNDRTIHIYIIHTYWQNGQTIPS